MKVINIKIRQFRCHIAPTCSNRVCYILAPTPIDECWMISQSVKYSCNIIVVSGADWDNDFTPWRAPGVTPTDPDFEGHASDFLTWLRNEIMPAAEKLLRIDQPERVLLGISLSGLFSMWAWMQGNDFANIATISGSYWYKGFTEWLKHNVTSKTGRVYLSLGNRESLSHNIWFRTIGECTGQVINILKNEGINVIFEETQGNHYADGILRMEKALSSIYLE
jgi:predicted alpha/beta superfamily hydrolase